MKLLFCFLLTISSVAYAFEETEALKAMRLSCERQSVGLGCFNYANMLLRRDPPDTERAEMFFLVGCKFKHSPSCQKEKWDLPESIKPVQEEPVEAAAATATETETTTETNPVESMDVSSLAPTEDVTAQDLDSLIESPSSDSGSVINE